MAMYSPNFDIIQRAWRMQHSRTKSRTLILLTATFRSSLSLLSSIALLGSIAVLVSGNIFANSPGWGLVSEWYSGNVFIFAAVAMSLFIAPMWSIVSKSEYLRVFCYLLHGTFWTSLAASFLHGMPLSFGAAAYICFSVWSWGALICELIIYGREYL